MLGRKSDSVDNRIAHTAEHAFIGSLQKLVGHTLRVRKVVHSESHNTAFIEIPHIDFDLIFRAASEVNSLIAEGRKIIIHSFPSLAEAKAEIPSLRANEERISGQVRVVEIEKHDMAACAMEHVENLKQCELFLVTRISKSGSEYEVDFVAGQKAREVAVSICEKLVRVCNEIGANVNTVESTAKKLKSESETNFKKLKDLSREKLEGIKPEIRNGIKIFKGVFSGLADYELRDFAGEKILDDNTAVVITNINVDAVSIVIAANEKLPVDCNKLFKEIAGTEGRGGGKPHFVTGIIKKDAAKTVVDRISNAIAQAG